MNKTLLNFTATALLSTLLTHPFTVVAVGGGQHDSAPYCQRASVLVLKDSGQVRQMRDGLETKNALQTVTQGVTKVTMLLDRANRANASNRGASRSFVTVSEGGAMGAQSHLRSVPRATQVQSLEAILTGSVLNGGSPPSGVVTNAQLLSLDNMASEPLLERQNAPSSNLFGDGNADSAEGQSLLEGGSPAVGVAPSDADLNDAENGHAHGAETTVDPQKAGWSCWKTPYPWMAGAAVTGAATLGVLCATGVICPGSCDEESDEPGTALATLEANMTTAASNLTTLMTTVIPPVVLPIVTLAKSFFTATEAPPTLSQGIDSSITTDLTDWLNSEAKITDLPTTTEEVTSTSATTPTPKPKRKRKGKKNRKVQTTTTTTPAPTTTSASTAELTTMPEQTTRTTATTASPTTESTSTSEQTTMPEQTTRTTTTTPAPTTASTSTTELTTMPEQTTRTTTTTPAPTTASTSTTELTTTPELTTRTTTTTAAPTTTSTSTTEQTTTLETTTTPKPKRKRKDKKNRKVQTTTTTTPEQTTRTTTTTPAPMTASTSTTELTTTPEQTTRTTTTTPAPTTASTSTTELTTTPELTTRTTTTTAAPTTTSTSTTEQTTTLETTTTPATTRSSSTTPAADEVCRNEIKRFTSDMQAVKTTLGNNLERCNHDILTDFSQRNRQTLSRSVPENDVLRMLNVIDFDNSNIASRYLEYVKKNLNKFVTTMQEDIVGQLQNHSCSIESAKQDVQNRVERFLKDVCGSLARKVKSNSEEQQRDVQAFMRYVQEVETTLEHSLGECKSHILNSVFDQDLEELSTFTPEQDAQRTARSIYLQNVDISDDHLEGLDNRKAEFVTTLKTRIVDELLVFQLSDPRYYNIKWATKEAQGRVAEYSQGVCDDLASKVHSNSEQERTKAREETMRRLAQERQQPRAQFSSQEKVRHNAQVLVQKGNRYHALIQLADQNYQQQHTSVSSHNTVVPVYQYVGRRLYCDYPDNYRYVCHNNGWIDAFYPDGNVFRKAPNSNIFEWFFRYS